MLDLWSRYQDTVGAAFAPREQRASRRRRRRRAAEEQALTVDQLKQLGVSKFRRRATGGGVEEDVGFLGDLRFVVGPHGSIKVEGYIDPDKAARLAALYRAP